VAGASRSTAKEICWCAPASFLCWFAWCWQSNRLTLIDERSEGVCRLSVDRVTAGLKSMCMKAGVAAAKRGFGCLSVVSQSTRTHAHSLPRRCRRAAMGVALMAAGQSCRLHCCCTLLPAARYAPRHARFFYALLRHSCISRAVPERARGGSDGGIRACVASNRSCNDATDDGRRLATWAAESGWRDIGGCRSFWSTLPPLLGCYMAQRSRALLMAKKNVWRPSSGGGMCSADIAWRDLAILPANLW